MDDLIMASAGPVTGRAGEPDRKLCPWLLHSYVIVAAHLVYGQSVSVSTQGLLSSSSHLLNSVAARSGISI